MTHSGRTLVCGMYSYNDYNPPVWFHNPPMQSDLSQPLIMSLPSSVNQWVTPHHMHSLESQSDSFAWPMVILGQWEARCSHSSRSVFILTPLLYNMKMCMIQMCWKWFQFKLVMFSVSASVETSQGYKGWLVTLQALRELFCQVCLICLWSG